MSLSGSTSSTTSRTQKSTSHRIHYTWAGTAGSPPSTTSHSSTLTQSSQSSSSGQPARSSPSSQQDSQFHSQSATSTTPSTSNAYGAAEPSTTTYVALKPSHHRAEPTHTRHAWQSGNHASGVHRHSHRPMTLQPTNPSSTFTVTSTEMTTSVVRTTSTVTTYAIDVLIPALASSDAHSVESQLSYTPPAQMTTTVSSSSMTTLPSPGSTISTSTASVSTSSTSSQLSSSSHSTSMVTSTTGILTTTSLTSTAPTTSATVFPATDNAAVAAQAKDQARSPGVVAGAAAGSIAAVVMILLVVMYFLRRRARPNSRHSRGLSRSSLLGGVSSIKNGISKFGKKKPKAYPEVAWLYDPVRPNTREPSGRGTPEPKDAVAPYESWPAQNHLQREPSQRMVLQQPTFYAPPEPYNSRPYIERKPCPLPPRINTDLHSPVSTVRGVNNPFLDPIHEEVPQPLFSNPVQHATSPRQNRTSFPKNTALPPPPMPPLPDASDYADRPDDIISPLVPAPKTRPHSYDMRYYDQESVYSQSAATSPIRRDHNNYGSTSPSIAYQTSRGPVTYRPSGAL